MGKKLALVNGDFLYFLKKYETQGVSIKFFSLGNDEVLQWKLQFLSLAYYSNYPETNREFSFLTPSLFLNFSAPEEIIFEKLHEKGWKDLEEFAQSFPGRLRIIYQWMLGGIHPWIDFPHRGRKAESLSSSFFRKPKVDGEPYDKVIHLGLSPEICDSELFYMTYSFKFLFPDNLTNYGIFWENEGNFGWFHAEENLLEIISFSEEVPEKSFFFLNEGTPVERRKILLSEKGKIVRKGRGYYFVIPPFGSGSEKFWKRLGKIVCLPAGGNKEECMKRFYTE